MPSKTLSKVKHHKSIIGMGHRKGRLQPKHEGFCRAIVVDGMSGAQAYRAHMATGEITTNSAHVMACRLLKDVKIQLRIAEMREADKRTVEEKLGFTRESAAHYLVSAIQTPISEIDDDSPLCQEKTVMETENGITTKLKSVNKLDALEKLGKLAGWWGNGESKGPSVVINLGALYSPATEVKGVRVVGEITERLAG